MSNGIKWKPFLQLINIKIREDYGWIVIDYVGMCFVDYVNAKCKFWQGEALRVKVQHHGSDKQWYLLYRGLDYGNGESEHRNSRNHAISATSPRVSM